jgi:sulfite reductase (NADPH) hemoprotein beta-component
MLNRCMENFICPERFVRLSRHPFSLNFYTHSQFKIAVAVPPSNDVDVFANDVGFIAIVDEKGELAGFNVAAGGGMGVTHGNKKTYPRIADVLGFCTVEQGKEVAEKIMLVQRDNGNRVEYVLNPNQLLQGADF